METNGVANVLNTLAGIMAENAKITFNHTIEVSTKTGGGDIRLTKDTVFVHPHMINDGTLIHKIIEQIFEMIATYESAKFRSRKRAIKQYKKDGKEAIEYLHRTLSEEAFRAWVDQTVQ